jgi:hypothetical protein
MGCGLTKQRQQQQQPQIPPLRCGMTTKAVRIDNKGAAE